MPLSGVIPADYDHLLAQKVEHTLQLLAPFSPPRATVVPSSPLAYRMRAEFRVWHDGEKLDYVMFRKDDPKVPVPMEQFPIGSTRIQSLMPELMALLKATPELRRKLFQVEFLSTLAGDTLVTLIYHRKLEAVWEAEARALADKLQLQIIGRSRKQKVVLERDYVNEALTIQGRPYRYRQYEQGFTQPNAKVNIQMIEWACECAAQLDGDLLELYAGNGNFTLPLASHFDQVIATELAKTSIKAARENVADNSICNIEIIRLSAQEVTQAINGDRVFRRLADLPQPLGDYDLRTVFVDPPRAGLDCDTEKMVANFDAIIYISCNPETLALNLQTLSHTHNIERFAMFDQFPYTHHMESGVLLIKKQTKK